MVQQITCSRCRRSVPQAESEFSTNGDLLCRSCGSLAEAHAEIDREVVHRTRSAHAGALADDLPSDAVESKNDGGVPRLGRSAEHRELDRLAREAQGQRLPETLRCSRCSHSVLRGASSYDVQGAPLCADCFARYDLNAAQEPSRRGQFWNGLIFTLVIGLVIALKVCAGHR